MQHSNRGSFLEVRGKRSITREFVGSIALDQKSNSCFTVLCTRWTGWKYLVPVWDSIVLISNQEATVTQTCRQSLPMIVDPCFRRIAPGSTDWVPWMKVRSVTVYFVTRWWLLIVHDGQVWVPWIAILPLVMDIPIRLWLKIDPQGLPFCSILDFGNFKPFWLVNTGAFYYESSMHLWALYK